MENYKISLNEIHTCNNCCAQQYLCTDSDVDEDINTNDCDDVSDFKMIVQLLNSIDTFSALENNDLSDPENVSNDPENVSSDPGAENRLDFPSPLFKSFKLKTNPNYIDGKCEKYGKEQKSFIYISEYNSSCVSVMNMNEIVITDNNIWISFHYPLKQEFLFEFKSSKSEGFTRSEIIQNIVDTYKYIYKTEEETTESQDFISTKKCFKCKKELVEIPEFSLASDCNEDACPICIEDYNQHDILCKLLCGHRFHKYCVYEWFDTNKNCPLCREVCENNISCGECVDGSIVNTYHGKIIPIDKRIEHGNIINRHETNGVYGIWGHDIEDLVIESLTYVPSKKILTMFIGS
jgi:hypothetical protein